MAIYTVDTNADIVDAGDGVLSLREALALADADRATADTILFAPAVQGQTIVLAGSQLTVNSDVTIDGGSGVTIDADEKSRVLLVQGDGTGRDARAPDHHRRPNDGRATKLAAASVPTAITTLTLDHSTVSGNSTAGDDAAGGGICGYDVTLTNSTVSGNSTAGDDAAGGGIYGNLRDADQQHGQRQPHGGRLRQGGGISGYVTLTNSTVSGNSTAGVRRGGGIDGDYDADQQHGQRQQHGGAIGAGLAAGISRSAHD